MTVAAIIATIIVAVRITIITVEVSALGFDDLTRVIGEGIGLVL